MSALSSTVRNKAGRPTKKTPARCKAILKGIESGWPYVVACSSAGTTYESFSAWCRTDEHFAAQVAMAEAVAIRTNLELIQAAARDKIWPAAAWLLERRHPELFSRPEVQLNLIQQTNINAQNGTGLSMEIVVARDVEFLGLAKTEGYQHRPIEREAREVEAEIVPEDLSGALAVASHPGGVVISESQAAENQRRMRRSQAKIEALLAAKQASRSTASSEVSQSDLEAAETLVAGPIGMPVGMPSEAW
jgi:hypothetical protein